MKLDSTDDSLSFSCIRLFRLVGGAPAQYAGSRGFKFHRRFLVGVFKSACGGTGSGAG